MRKTFLDKRIPSLLGLLFLAVSIGMVSWFGQNYTRILTRAAVGETPKNIQISNITDTSLTVSYTTDDETISTLAYGKDETLGQVGLDNRDRQTGKATGRRVHYVTLSGLSAGSKYFFAIQSGENIFLNNDKPYETTTEKLPFENKSQQVSVVSGSVHLPDGNIPLEGIAYLSTGAASQSAQLSVLLQPDGSYSFKDLRALSAVGQESILKLTVTNGSLESRVSVLAKYANPVPLITLSKDYDFNLDSIASNSAEMISPAPAAEFPLVSTEIASEPAILTPKDTEKFKDAQPLFKGTAVPGETIEIAIESNQEIQASVQADNFGNWQFRPDTPLNPGEHIITIVTRNANGILQTIKRSFTVYAAGSQFTEPTATPVQTPFPTVMITVKPTSIPTSIPTTMPTITIMPSPIITPTTIPTIAPTAVPTPTTAPVITIQPLPPSGSSAVLIGGIVVTLLIVSGFMIFFL